MENLKKPVQKLLEFFAICLSIACLVWSFYITTEFQTLILGVVAALLVYKLPIWLKINWNGIATALLTLNTVILSLLPQSSTVFDGNNPHVALTWCFLLVLSIFGAETMFKTIYNTPKEKINKFFSWSGYIATLILNGYSLYFFANIDYTLEKPIAIVMLINYFLFSGGHFTYDCDDNQED